MSQRTGDTVEPTGSGPLEPSERDELERLRKEVEALRQSRDRRRRGVGWRSVVAAFIIIVGCVLAPSSLVTVWVHNQVADTDRFVATMSPLIEEPSVQAAVTDRVTDAIFRQVDAEELATEAVDALAARGLAPAVAERLRGLTGPLASGVRGFVHDRVADLVASEQGRAVWNRAIRAGHEQMVAVLSGQSSAVTISGGQVRIDLAPFIDAAKTHLVDAGFTAAQRIPEVHPTIAVGDAQTLVQAQNAYRALDRLATWLPWVTLVLLAVGVYVARNHRRALVGTGLGVAAGMVVVAIALFVARSMLVSSVPSRSAAPASAAFDVVVRFLRDGLRVTFVVALLVALAAFLVGPSSTAVQIRGWLSRFVAWVRRGGARAGLRPGKVGVWVHAHRRMLQVALVVLAILVFVFLTSPSGIAALVIALVLVFCLGVIQLLDQPPATEPPADQQAGTSSG